MRLYRHIETLWDYMQLKHELKPADCLFVMCSNDVRVAEHAAKLYHQKLAPLIVFSGGKVASQMDCLKKARQKPLPRLQSCRAFQVKQFCSRLNPQTVEKTFALLSND